MEPTRNTEGMSIEKVREMVAAMPENLHFIDMAETIYEGLCAMAGTEWETRTGPDLIARLPENEDGSDPRWKLLEHAPTLARMVVQEREAREAAERVMDEAMALWKDIGHPMLLAAAQELRERRAALAQPAEAGDQA